MGTKLFKITLFKIQLPVSRDQPKHLWEDLAHSIAIAREFVFIVGWSVDFKVRLRRDRQETMGELLVRKAKSGVQVYITHWFDNADMMGTGYRESAAYFKD